MLVQDEAVQGQALVYHAEQELPQAAWRLGAPLQFWLFLFIRS